MSIIKKKRKEKIMEGYVTLKSYDGKLVRVPEEKKKEYIRNQEKIKVYLSKGKTMEEVKELLNNEDEKDG